MKTKSILTISLIMAMSNTANASAVEEWKSLLEKKFTHAKSWIDSKVNKKEKSKIVICMASEKKAWIESVLPQFNKEYPNITTEVIYKGSGDMMKSLNEGNLDKCSLESPASSLSALIYDKFDKVDAVPLVYSPLVMVTFSNKAKILEQNLSTGYNLSNVEKFANKKWSDVSTEYKKFGKIRVAFTDPEKSNSGLVTLLSKAYTFFDSYDPLTEKQINNPEFHKYINNFWKNTNHKETSTGKLTRTFKTNRLKYTTIFTYENMVPDLLTKYANNIKVTYPEKAVLNDHPVFITAKDDKVKNASKVFINFLLSKDIQKIATDKFAFRPSNPSVTIGKSLGFATIDIGIVDLPTTSDVPLAILDIAKGNW